MNENEVLECCLYGIKPGEKYPATVRKFAYTLMCHSSSAYKIVRSQFNDHLPHPRTMKKWMQNSDINGEPGIREETLLRLKDFVRNLNEKGEKLICSLLLDEVYIRKQLYYDQHSYQYIGYPTYPPNFNETKTSSKKNAKEKSFLATRAIVFMLSGINKKFYFPVAYHFVNGMPSKDLSALTKDIIMRVCEQGVSISNLTFDGASVN